MKRSNSEILFAVLNVCGEGTDKKTRIMYRVNLSHDQLKDCLRTLSGRKLLEVSRVGDSERYYLTKDGHSILEQGKSFYRSLGIDFGKFYGFSDRTVSRKE